MKEPLFLFYFQNSLDPLMSILFFNNFSALTNLYYFNLQVLLEQSTDQADVLSSGELMDTDCSQDKEVQV